MTTTRDDIRRWLDRAIKKGASHMVVMCDTYDWSDYPVFVMPGEDPKSKLGGAMQKPMECYDLSLDINDQLAERRANHWDMHHDQA